jgi:hypothetical protein
MNNLEIYERVRAVPPEAKKEIKGGRMNGKTDINPMWRIKILTEIYGPCGIGWYYVPTKKWIETFENTIAAFVDIELFVKSGDGWSMPISGTGGSMFVAKENSGPFVSDECYKMATTDAISVSCKQLGIGADVYWGTDKSKYSGNDATDKPIGKPLSELPNTTNNPLTVPTAEYRCEVCNKAFVDFDWRDKHYTAQDGYEMAKKKCGGKALCNKCKKEAGIS